MNKLQIFASSYKKSFTSPSYYKEIMITKMWFVIKYATFLMFIYALVLTALFTASLVKIADKAPKVVQTVYQQASLLYPEGLIVSVDNGKVATNSSEPTLIKIPQAFIKSLSDSKEVDQKTLDEISQYNLLVIDTNGSIDEFAKYKTAILVTEKNIATLKEMNSSGSVKFETTPIPQSSEKFIITKEIYLGFLNNLNSEVLTKIPSFIKGFLVSFMLIFPFAATVFLLYTNMFMVLILALFLLIFVKASGRKYSYRQLYKMGILSLSLPITLKMVFFITGWLGIFSMSVPFFYGIVHLGLCIYMLTKIPTDVATSVSENKETTKPIEPEVV